MTIRDLVEKSASPYSLEWWMQVAKSCDLNVTPDTVLDREQLSRLKKKYDEICAPVKKPQPKTDEEKRAASIRALEKAVQENVIFVDLSSILSPAGEAAIQNILPLLYRYQKRLFIPQSVTSKLMKLGNEAEDPEQRLMCRKRYNAIYAMLKAGVAQVRGFGVENSTPAKDLLTAAAYFRMKYSLLFLTQDEKLAADLLSLNNQRSADGKTIVVKRINKYGFLSNVIDPPKNGGKPFRLYTKPRTEPDTRLPVTQCPRKGEYVYNGPNRTGPILLEEEIGGGGEGTIYRTNTPCVAKVYKPECCTAYRQEKIRKLLDAKLSYTGICFPMSMLYNENSEFIGYMMMEAKGHPIQNSIFRKQLFARKLPGWDKRDLVQCTITILHKFKYLHDNGIIVGDINPSNILVVSPLEVYFVDTDSYQIDDLPCPVGTPLFTAPEIHQRHRSGELRDFSEVMRTKQNEYFAIATLLFMMMMPGKPPYTHTGGQDIVENILHMHFPYALGERRGQNVPDGTWKFIWSHLSRRLKDIFHMIFTKDESKSQFNMNERLDVEQWIIEMDAYMRTLEKWQKLLEDAEPELEDLRSRIAYEKLLPGGKADELEKELQKLIASLPDPESLKIYPTRLKRLRDKVYVECAGGCGKEYPEDDDRLKAGYCPECQRKGETVECLSCGSEFVFTNYEKHFRGFQRPHLCPECRKKKDEIQHDEKCAKPSCYNRVQLTRSGVAYHKAHQKAIPTLCNDCYKREQRSGSRGGYGSGRPADYKARPAQESPARQEKSPAKEYVQKERPLWDEPVQKERLASAKVQRPTTDRKPEEKGSGLLGCFITTAVCGYLGKRDDCQELMDFRNFRDNWLRHQPGGEEQIREYYETAPELVRRMQASADYEKICTALWEDYLVPCHRMIRSGRMEQCREHYTAMVRYLRKTVGVQ